MRESEERGGCAEVNRERSQPEGGGHIWRGEAGGSFGTENLREGEGGGTGLRGKGGGGEKDRVRPPKTLAFRASP